MGLRNVFSDLLDTVMPHKYSTLSKRSLRTSLRTFLHLLVIGGILMVVAFLIRAPAIAGDFSRDLGKFSTLHLDAEVALIEPFVILDRPLIRVDFSKNLTEETILINRETVQYRLLAFGSYREFTWDQFNDVVHNRKTFVALIMGGLLMLLPSLYVLAVIGFAVKYLLLALFSVSILSWICSFTPRRTPWTPLFCASLAGLTPLAILEMILLPWHRFSFEPWVIGFVIILILALALGGKVVVKGRYQKKHQHSPAQFIEKEDNFISLRNDKEEH